MKILVGKTSIECEETVSVDTVGAASGVIASMEDTPDGCEIVIESMFHRVEIVCQPRPEGLSVGDKINYKYTI